MTRSEHLRWAKDRALEYLDADDENGAFASFTSDLGKHPELASALELQTTLGAQQFFAGLLRGRMREWIEGFN